MKVPIISCVPPLSQKTLRNILSSKNESKEFKDLAKKAIEKIDKASKDIGQKKETISAFVDYHFKTIYIHF